MQDDEYSSDQFKLMVPDKQIGQTICHQDQNQEESSGKSVTANTHELADWPFHAIKSDAMDELEPAASWLERDSRTVLQTRHPKSTLTPKRQDFQIGENIAQQRQTDSSEAAKPHYQSSDARGRLERRRRKRRQVASHLRNHSRASLTLLAVVLLELFAIPRVDSEPTIEVTKFHVPSRAQVGKPARLTCQYQLKGVTLHAMKLFKDNNEFYRYSPTNRLNQREEKMAFAQPGVVVDLRASNGSSVLLRPLTNQSAGTYKCQVSIEDSFKSVSAERRMELAASQDNQAANQKITNTNQRKSGFFYQELPKSLIQQQQQQQTTRGSSQALNPLNPLATQHETSGAFDTIKPITSEFLVMLMMISLLAATSLLFN